MLWLKQRVISDILTATDRKVASHKRVKCSVMHSSNHERLAGPLASVCTPRLAARFIVRKLREWLGCGARRVVNIRTEPKAAVF
jgi:hypothetical protein